MGASAETVRQLLTHDDLLASTTFASAEVVRREAHWVAWNRIGRCTVPRSSF